MNDLSSLDKGQLTKIQTLVRYRLLKHKKFMPIAGALILVFAAFMLASRWMSTPARPARMPRPVQAKLVEVAPIRFQQTQPLLQVHGEVIAATSIVLYPQVSGRVISTNGDLAPGTQVIKGQVLASLEQDDYLLALQSAKAVLADAEASYQQELGDQAVANRELALLAQQLKTDLSVQQRQLILRQPQLAQAQATIDSAKADLAKAKLDLARTQIRAPFSGVVTAKHVDVGSQVSSSTQIVGLVDVASFWIKVTLPANYLQHLSFADENPSLASKIKVYIGSPVSPSEKGSNARVGEVYKRLPELDLVSRQAQILLRVDDPLALKPENRGAAQLMVNDYVAVDIVGKSLQEVVVINENLVHNGNQVWLYEDGRLQIYDVDVLWREQGRIIVSSGLKQGALLITTDIANAYNGLPVSTEATVVARPKGSGRPGGTREPRGPKGAQMEAPGRPEKNHER